MFSPEASVSNSQGASLRNPRRRRRIESETQKRPRKRSRIASDQFQPVVNGHTLLNGNVSGGHRAVVDIPVRENRVVSGSSLVDSSNVLVLRLTLRRVCLR